MGRQRIHRTLVAQSKTRRGIPQCSDTVRDTNKLLLSIDGTGLFSSTKVSCTQCGVKKHSLEETSFYHQMLATAVVHPAQKTLLTLYFEPIVKSYGSKKNDCERNARKRLLDAIHQQYDKRRFFILKDALAVNAPHIKTLVQYGMDYINNIQPAGNASLFEQLQRRFHQGNGVEHEETLAYGTQDSTFRNKAMGYRERTV